MNLVCAYVGKDDKTLVIFNGINHIKIGSISLDGKITQHYKDIVSYLEFIESKFTFYLDEIYGYMTCKPLNSGCSFEVRLMYEDCDIETLKTLATKNDLATSKILNTGLEVFNRNKINMAESDIVLKFIEFLTHK